VAFLKQLLTRYDSLSYGRATARRWALRARRSLESVRGLSASVHRDFLFDLTDFVVARDY
jgi:hypothetical protein